jgi:integration host factor subunit beta
MILELSKKNSLPEKQAAEIVDIAFDGFANELKNGSRIEIRGFGSFAIKEYGAYEGRNPKTGDKVEVQPKRLPVFKVGKELREMVCAEGSCRVIGVLCACAIMRPEDTTTAPTGTSSFLKASSASASAIFM